MLRIATNLACANGAAAYLVGADPERADADLGYILPSEAVTDKPVPLYGFKEKPSVDYAQELIALGALWNLFILIGSVGALLQLFDEGHAALVRDLRHALSDETGLALNALYSKLQPLDLSRDVLELQAHRLQVIRTSHCGWADLGTPKRVAATVRSLAHRKDALEACEAPKFLELRTPYR